jgi:hypothetical protein
MNYAFNTGSKGPSSPSPNQYSGMALQPCAREAFGVFLNGLQPVRS